MFPPAIGFMGPGKNEDLFFIQRDRKKRHLVFSDIMMICGENVTSFFIILTEPIWD